MNFRGDILFSVDTQEVRRTFKYFGFRVLFGRCLCQKDFRISSLLTLLHENSNSFRVTLAAFR